MWFGVLCISALIWLFLVGVGVCFWLRGVWVCLTVCGFGLATWFVSDCVSSLSVGVFCAFYNWCVVRCCVTFGTGLGDVVWVMWFGWLRCLAVLDSGSVV